MVANGWAVTAGVNHSNVGAIRRLFRGRQLEVATLALLSLISGLSEAAFLFVVAKTAISLSDSDTQIGLIGTVEVSIGHAAAIALVFVLIRVIFSVASTWKAAVLGTSLPAGLRRTLSTAFIESTWEAQHGQRSGRLQELLTTFTATGTTLVTSLTSTVKAGFNLLALLVMAIVIDPFASTAVIAAIFALGLLLRPLRSRVKTQAHDHAERGMEFATALSEVSELGLEMHVFGVQGPVESNIDRLVARNERSHRRLMFWKGLLPVVYTGLAYAVVVGALAFIAWVGDTDVASMGAVILMLMRSLSYGQNIQVALAAIYSSLPFMQTFQAELDYYGANRRPMHGRPVESIGQIELRGVSFEYVKGQEVLHDINAEIRQNEVVGIIGPSGSGKSTLVQLLLGLRTPTSGRILANGADISSFARDAWVRKVTFVPQQARLVSGTIADNIAFFREGVSEEELERAARLANLHDEIMAFPDGYRHQVGEHGGHLSGGQQQRLVIARALVEDPDLLILDEPTSALDVKSEYLIRQILTELSAHMTILVIAHRLSTVAICDRIMVVQDGYLKGFDAPAKLENSSEFYRESLALSALR